MTVPRRILSLPLSILALALAACGGPDANPESQDTGQLWDLAETPIFSFTEDEANDVMLSEVVDAAVLQDGFVIGDYGALHLIFLDDSGNVTQVAGRAGQGPGEFRRLTDIRRFGNGVLAWDGAQRKAALFDAAGQHLRDVRLSASGAWTALGGVQNAGIITAPVGATREGGSPRPYSLWNEDGSIERVISGSVDYDPNRLETPVLTLRGMQGSCQPTIIESMLDSTIYLADTARGDVFTLTLTGEMDLRYRPDHWPVIDEAFADSLASHFRLLVKAIVPDASDARVAESAALAVERYGGRGNPPVTLWEQMLVDPAGGVWLMRSNCLQARAHGTWDVVSPDGHLRMTVELPPRVRLIAAKNDQVLVVRRDSLDVEHVELYSLRQRRE